MLRENYILVTPRFQRKSRVRIETKRIDQLRVQNNFTLFFFLSQAWIGKHDLRNIRVNIGREKIMILYKIDNVFVREIASEIFKKKRLTLPLVIRLAGFSDVYVYIYTHTSIVVS